MVVTIGECKIRLLEIGYRINVDAGVEFACKV